jgi:aquaporin Z
MEAAELGTFMVSALVFAAVLEHPLSPVSTLFPSPDVRRAVTGLAMGATAVLIIYSPWGRRSGAHFNPAVTLAFWRLGRVRGRDAATYAAGQFLGAAAAVLVASALADGVLGDPRVRYAVTVPGSRGLAVAFVAEAAIAFVLMRVVLAMIGRGRWEAYAGWVAGLLVALYITFEAPLSGMSMNPARSLASALGAGHWTGLWIYFAAPPLGMLAAAELHRRSSEARSGCAKLHHSPAVRCLFCGHDPATSAGPAAAGTGRTR